MLTVTADNVNGAFITCLANLNMLGEREHTRNGVAVVLPAPVSTLYMRPQERVLFSRYRVPNPYFHLMEALWMLKGRNDLSFPAMFNSGFKKYSDDGVTLHGAYGHRWRQHFGVDQISTVVKLLKDDPQSRRAVIAMYDPHTDGEVKGKKDIPCNTTIYFRVYEGALRMTVCCRSNDAVWGAYGSNVVHFSILQEFIASTLQLHVGPYWQISHNMHIYQDHFEYLDSPYTMADDLYEDGEVTPTPLWTKPQNVLHFLGDLDKFFDGPAAWGGFTTSFFNDTVEPMYMAYMSRKEGGDGAEHTNRMNKNSDWYRATEYWRLSHEDK